MSLRRRPQPSSPQESADPSIELVSTAEEANAEVPNENECALEVYDAEEAARLEEEQERMMAELSMYKNILGTVFSCRKPRDVISGTSSGLKTVARGVGIGLASLVAQPYLGAKAGGVKGFAKGVGAGIATCAASTVTGTVVGTSQIVRGVVNTPGAIVRAARGQVWNAEKRCWEDDWYSLPEEEAEVFGSSEKAKEAGGTDESAGSAEGGGGSAGTKAATASCSSTTGSKSAASRRPRKKVADTGLYDLLEVTPEATESEIRRAFYKKSLVLHPDKNPNNPVTTQQFQAVNDAYRVLGDTERRRIYDEHGQESAAAGMPKIEPVVFFAALFGSHHFEPYVGRLRLAQDIDGDMQVLIKEAAAAGNEEDVAVDPLKLQRAYNQTKVVQREREVRCAVDLAKRLAPVVEPGTSQDENPEAFGRWREDRATEVAQLTKVPCGVEMMYLVGWVYANRSRQFLAGWMIKRVAAQIEGKMHLSQTKAKMYSSVGKTCFKIMKSADKQKKKKSLPSKAEKDDGVAGGDDAASASASTAERPVGTSDATAAPADGGADSSSQAAGGVKAATSPAPASAEAGAGMEKATDEVEHKTEEAEQDLDPTQLLPGTLVMIRGLKGATDLNDEVAIVIEFDQSADRYVVQMLPDGGPKSIRRDNLFVLEDAFTGEGAGNAGDTSRAGGGASSSSAAPPSGDATSATAGDEDLPGADDADMADAFKECMPLLHDALWNATALDIEFTLNKVIRKVLRDMSVDKATRWRRAQALLQLGLLLQEPWLEQRRQSKVAGPSSTSLLAGPTSPRADGTNAEDVGTSGTSRGKRSMIMRFKPRTPWSRSGTAEERRNEKAKALEAKRKRLEGALAMMAAGASTEDVDEMVAARNAMDAELEAEGGGF